MSVNDTTISLVLPTYNDAAHLMTVVQECLTVLPHYFADFEIIIVDDGSQDTTSDSVDYLAATYDPVMVIHHPRAHGYGSALTKGLRSARGDYVLCTDARSQISIGEVARLMPFIKDYAVVAGYRLPRRGAQRARSSVLQRLINRLFALDLRDIGCRFSIFRADVLHTMQLEAQTALILVEMYARAGQQASARIQVGVQHYQRTDTLPGDRYTHIGLRSLWEALWLRTRLRGVPPAPAASLRPLWQQKATLGAGVAAVAGGIWLLLRRRVLFHEP